jgi:hypothetical protein
MWRRGFEVNFRDLHVKTACLHQGSQSAVLCQRAGRRSPMRKMETVRSLNEMDGLTIKNMQLAYWFAAPGRTNASLDRMLQHAP